MRRPSSSTRPIWFQKSYRSSIPSTAALKPSEVSSSDRRQSPSVSAGAPPKLRRVVSSESYLMSSASYPFTYWVGMDTDPRTTPEALAEFNRFYSTTHVGEVLAAHPGFVQASRYELLDPDPRGGVHCGPRWLAMYEMTDEAAALQYIKDNERPWLHRRRYSPWPAARRRAKTPWRMLWRQISATGTTDQPPESIFM